MPTATVDEFLPHGEGIRAALRGEKPEARNGTAARLAETLWPPLLSGPHQAGEPQKLPAFQIPSSAFLVSRFFPPG
jgi:hypothetical protein